MKIKLSGVPMRVSLTNGRTAKRFNFNLGVPFTSFIFNWTVEFLSVPTAWTKGISSRCMDGRHVLFLDYDDQDLNQVEGEVKYLQNFFKLSHAFVFANDKRDSFHVIFLDKFSLKKAYAILSETNIDADYLSSVKRVRGREWLLRIDGKGERKKPFFLKIIKSKFDEYQISTAHLLFLRGWYGVPMVNYNNPDNLTLIPVIDYNTGNKVAKATGGGF